MTLNQLLNQSLNAYEGEDPWAFEDEVKNTINNEENN